MFCFFRWCLSNNFIHSFIFLNCFSCSQDCSGCWSQSQLSSGEGGLDKSPMYCRPHRKTTDYLHSHLWPSQSSWFVSRSVFVDCGREPETQKPNSTQKGPGPGDQTHHLIELHSKFNNITKPLYRKIVAEMSSMDLKWRWQWFWQTFVKLRFCAVTLTFIYFLSAFNHGPFVSRYLCWDSSE